MKIMAFTDSSQYPLVPGHELAGVVTEVGANVKDIKVKGKLMAKREGFKNLSHGIHVLGGYPLEHKTCDILAAERLRLMRFDNRLIIDSFQKAICILKW